MAYDFSSFFAATHKNQISRPTKNTQINKFIFSTVKYLSLFAGPTNCCPTTKFNLFLLADQTTQSVNQRLNLPEPASSSRAYNNSSSTTEPAAFLPPHQHESEFHQAGHQQEILTLDLSLIVSGFDARKKRASKERHTPTLLRGRERTQQIAKWWVAWWKTFSTGTSRLNTMLDGVWTLARSSPRIPNIRHSSTLRANPRRLDRAWFPPLRRPLGLGRRLRTRFRQPQLRRRASRARSLGLTTWSRW